MPPQFKHQLEAAWHRKFSLKERFLIALGFHANLVLVIYMEQRPGKYQANLELFTTADLGPEPMNPSLFSKIGKRLKQIFKRS